MMNQLGMEGVLLLAVLGIAAGLGGRLLARKRKDSQQQRAERRTLTEVPTFRVVALGPSGARKTLLLASMYHNLQTPFGTTTGETREFTFSVTTRAAGDSHTILRLGYLEYAGELLTEPQAPGSTAQQDLIGRRLQQALTAMIAPMMTVFSPITFVITKWDLLTGVHPDENVRLGIVRNLLLSNPGFRDLVRMHSARRVVRLVPVSAVGPEFAAIDPDGVIIKRCDGRVHPTNVDVPISAVVPDVFEQLERSLDEATRQAVLAEARRLAYLGPAQALRALATFIGQAAGAALLGGLRGLPALASDVSVGLFLDSRGATLADRQSAVNNRLTDTERRLESLQTSRRRVLRELQGRVDRLEGQLPTSRLSNES